VRQLAAGLQQEFEHVIKGRTVADVARARDGLERVDVETIAR
jgi:hypothetical protein